ncbi:hypothetical protein EMA8858_02326 [Emticicia aquatica]|uniref:DUF1778 domain-containing protein n=1 Tax=Emticicia aquatica TaxID=1681835 RepID=A0ABN8EU81_9BACT|nr:ribbon-helix-helix protein, CopG family [Emticicia aquatica]CAH0996196.1 hypothetical protein EMA8858_02326 [Emticicia aquatica]
MAKVDNTNNEEPNQSELIQFRCTSELKAKLQKLAEKEGMNVNKFVRKLATKKVTASERPVTPTNPVTAIQSPNEWDKKAIQEMLMVLATIFGIVMLFRVFSRG